MTNKEEIFEIDGSFGEGGGQVLRNSTSLAAILCKPIKISNIRARRSKPGLKPQHLTGIQTVAQFCNAKLEGAHLHSQSVTFIPSKLNAEGQYIADTRTAGSCTLLCQIALPCMIFGAKKTIAILKGGTNVAFSPPIDEMIHVFRPIVKQFGFDFSLDIEKRGFYPKGGGIIRLTVEQPIKQLKPITLIDRGEITKITINAIACGKFPIKLAEEAAKEAKRLLSEYKNVQVNVNNDERTTNASAIVLNIIAESSTGCLMGSTVDNEGKKVKNIESFAKKAIEKIKKQFKEEGCVDEHVQDQLILFMALAKGKSKIRTGPLTLHTKTAIHFAEYLTGAKFTIIEDGLSRIIECEGIGFENPNL